MRRIPYATVDVFADRPLEGNPLAVVPDAAGLSDREMLAVAREFNLSETTFVLRRERSVERTEGFRTRIFSTQEEMPFAGHPTLGTAAVLRQSGEGPEVVLQLNVGRVPVRFSSRAGHEFGEMTQVDPTFGAVHDRERVAEALGLPPGEIVADLPVETVSTGVPFAIVPIGRLSTLRAWVPEWPRMERYLRRTDAKFFYLVCRETVAPEANLHARMAFYAGDDPATGSAAGPAAAWLVRHGQVPSGGPVEIEQGLEAGRPSRLSARATRHGEKVTDVRVGGGFAPVGQGELRLP
ncbi:MAG TPA: PhzF family phenazine biosynthesis protein [Thermoplasmata archaeon]|nr:PhzF family phenazine biosynthesis protein [Thermoplasmata archaeon]